MARRGDYMEAEAGRIPGRHDGLGGENSREADAPSSRAYAH